MLLQTRVSCWPWLQPLCHTVQSCYYKTCKQFFGLGPDPDTSQAATWDCAGTQSSCCSSSSIKTWW